MKLIDIVQIRANGYFEYMPGLAPVNSFHPPSLANPKQVPQEFPADGFHRGDSKAARAKAVADLQVILDRTLRNGKPEVAQTALMTPPNSWRTW